MSLRDEVYEAHAEINDKIERLATYPETCYRLVEFTRLCSGDHVEIGCLYGGSLILVAMFKAEGHIYGIDPLDQYGYYGTHDWSSGKYIWPVNRILRENVREFGLEQRITHIDKFSDPWPNELEESRFDTAFIDGDHTMRGAYNDFLNLRSRVSRYILWDNVEDHEQVRAAFDLAAEHLSWESVMVEDNIGVLEYVGQAES